MLSSHICSIDTQDILKSERLISDRTYMSYQTRRDLYKRIEKVRGNSLITYVTSLRPNASAQIAGDVIPEIIRQIEQIPKEKSEIDFLIVSNGGDPIVAWRIISLLRSRFERLNVLLPYSAYSAATLIALGADTIVMHPFASLGPVDPQLVSTRQNGGQNRQVSQFGSEDLVHYLAFVRENVGITDQAQLQKSFELLCNDVGAIGIGSAKRSSQLMLSLGEKLLTLHMQDKNEARSIAESLNKSYYHHGYSVDRNEARGLRLAVQPTNDKLEELIWKVWEDLSNEMECTTPFDPLEIVYSHPKAAQSLDVTNQIHLPANLPPQLVQQILQQFLAQLHVQPVVPVEYSIFYAAVEGSRGFSHFKQHAEIRAIRLPDMNVNVNITPRSQKWVYTSS